MAQNIMDGGDVRSGCVVATLKNKINLLGAQKPAKGRCIPKFDVTHFPGFAHSLGFVTSFQGRDVFSWMSGGQSFQSEPSFIWRASSPSHLCHREAFPD